MEDLRANFITQDFLRRMSERARNWNAEFISEQLSAFARSLPDYPELVEVLEGELHRRRLNSLKNEVRRLSGPELTKRMKEAMSQFQSGRISRDELEVIETIWNIRSGKRLSEEYKPGE